GLIHDLDLDRELRWLDSKVGFLHDGKLYPFVTPWDLLRFQPLSLLDRLRLGLVGMHLRRTSRWEELEPFTAAEWIIQHLGQRNYDVVWGPLLRGKFGASYAEVGMVWFWGKIRLRFASRRGPLQREVLGYLEGSFGRLVGGMKRRIQAAGGIIHTQSPVARVEVEEWRVAGVKAEGEAAGGHPCQAVVATVANPIFAAMAPFPEEYRQKLGMVRYQGAACLVLVMNKRLSPFYWLNISDASVAFVAAIEHTNFLPPERYGGKHILYLSNYLDPESPLFRMNAEELFRHYSPHLKTINPDFDPSWVEECHLFKDPFAQPVITTNYSAKMPPLDTPISGLYLANT
ncbi:MAG TPA: amine oxidase, partial [Dehalococcoidia bacterium]|nr:amine oxidase [Dehalococcoidia bacterium]